MRAADLVVVSECFEQWAEVLVVGLLEVLANSADHGLLSVFTFQVLARRSLMEQVTHTWGETGRTTSGWISQNQSRTYPTNMLNCHEHRLHFLYLKYNECFWVLIIGKSKLKFPNSFSHQPRINHKLSTILAANLFLTYQTQNVTDDLNYQSCQFSSRLQMCDHWECLMSLQFYKLMHRQKKWFTQWQKLWKYH